MNNHFTCLRDHRTRMRTQHGSHVCARSALPCLVLQRQQAGSNPPQMSHFLKRSERIKRTASANQAQTKRKPSANQAPRVHPLANLHSSWLVEWLSEHTAALYWSRRARGFSRVARVSCSAVETETDPICFQRSASKRERSANEALTKLRPRAILFNAKPTVMKDKTQIRYIDWHATFVFMAHYTAVILVCKQDGGGNDVVQIGTAAWLTE